MHTLDCIRKRVRRSAAASVSFVNPMALKRKAFDSFYKLKAIYYMEMEEINSL
jgi:hypothetical protein